MPLTRKQRKACAEPDPIISTYGNDYHHEVLKKLWTMFGRKEALKILQGAASFFEKIEPLQDSTFLQAEIRPQYLKAYDKFRDLVTYITQKHGHEQAAYFDAQCQKAITSYKKSMGALLMHRETQREVGDNKQFDEEETLI